MAESNKCCGTIQISASRKNKANLPISPNSTAEISASKQKHVEIIAGSNPVVGIESSTYVKNYEALRNKPQINGVTLIGNKTSDQLHLQDKLIGTQGEGQNIKTINGQSLLGSGNLIVTPENYLKNAEISGKTLIITKQNNATISFAPTEENYTTNEKNKLQGIASGAQVNVQSDWNENNSSVDSYIKNKPDIDGKINTKVSLEADLREAADAQLNNNINSVNNNLTSHIDNVGNPHNVTKAQVGLGDVVNKPMDNTPTANSDNYVKSSGVKDYVDTYGGKIDIIKKNGVEQQIINKTVDLFIPTKTSEITNDSNFQNNTQVTSFISAHNNEDLETVHPVIREFIEDEIENRELACGALSDRLDEVEELIPSQASSSNQLGDKAFINSSIENMAAFHVTKRIGSGTQEDPYQFVPFDTKAELLATTVVYIDGVEKNPGKNDYAIVLEDESKQGTSALAPSTKYRYPKSNTEPYDPSCWEYMYPINNTRFTAAQMAAINSGITSILVSDISLNTAARHSHSNMSVLNSLTQAVITNSHSHSNKSLLDSYTQSEVDLSDAVSKKHSHGNIEVLNALTQGVIDNSHTHSNKALLDTYDQTNANISDAVTKKHEHNNKSTLDGITTDNLVTTTEKNTWNGKQNKLTQENAGDSILISEGSGGHNLPSAYQEVNYLESTGTQCIDTGVVANQDTKIDIDYKMNDYTGKAIYGSRIAYNNRTFSAMIGGNNNTSSFQYNTEQSLGDIMYENGTRYHVVQDKNLLYVDGVLKHTFTTGTFTCPSNLYLYAVNQNGSIPFYGKISVYNSKVYDNGTLVRNFIPCYRKSDSVAGMYDLVNDQFYTNSGTGSFVVGPVITSVQQISFTNTHNYQTGTQVETLISTHNTANNSHQDIRNTLAGKTSINDSSTTSTTETWSANKLNTTIGNIEAVLDEIRGE